MGADPHLLSGALVVPVGVAGAWAASSERRLQHPPPLIAADAAARPHQSPRIHVHMVAPATATASPSRCVRCAGPQRDTPTAVEWGRALIALGCTGVGLQLRSSSTARRAHLSRRGRKEGDLAAAGAAG